MNKQSGFTENRGRVVSYDTTGGRQPAAFGRPFHTPRGMIRTMSPTNLRRMGLAYSLLGAGILAFDRGMLIEGSPLAWRGWMFLMCGIAIALFPKMFKWVKD
jgi:hypothetical protein